MNWAMERACQPIADHYGLTNQLNILQEECGELIQAASNVLRVAADANAEINARAEAVEKLIEELADVEIMTAQVKYLIGPDTAGRVESIAATKIVRQKARIADEAQKGAGCTGDACTIGKGES